MWDHIFDCSLYLQYQIRLLQGRRFEPKRTTPPFGHPSLVRRGVGVQPDIPKPVIASAAKQSRTTTARRHEIASSPSAPRNDEMLAGLLRRLCLLAITENVGGDCFARSQAGAWERGKYHRIPWLRKKVQIQGVGVFQGRSYTCSRMLRVWKITTTQ